MIVVDSSVWIDYFNGLDNDTSNHLDQLLGAQPILVGDLILAEVLQGFRHNTDYRAARGGDGRVSGGVHGGICSSGTGC